MVLTTGLESTTGAGLPSEVTWSFSTAAPMHVVNVSPEDDAEGVGLHDPVRITFDAPIDPTTVTPTSLSVRGSGWYNGQWYYAQNLPGFVKYFDGDTTLEWWPEAQQGLSEYRTGYQVTVTTGVRSTSGAALEAAFESEFHTQMLSPSFYYKLRVLGYGDDWALGYYGDGARLLTGSVGPEFDWYGVPLGNGSTGLHNRGREQLGLPKSLMEQGADAKAVLVGWNGSAPMQWFFDKYGGKTGEGKPFESPSLYYMYSAAAGADSVMQALDQNGAPELYVRNKGGHIDSLWYFTRGAAK